LIRSEEFAWVESVTLEDAVPCLDRIAPSGLLAHLGELDLRCNGDRGWLPPLLAIEELNRLRVVRVSQIGLWQHDPETLSLLRERFGDRVRID
ncbi:MAG: hypothetical protein K2W96_15580, partial [Gemmataceae bacterium]|nr:hypothetical protein [Gemmataceae bacterium]